ncbi:MAG: TrkA family potassium uptake protein [Ruminococcaceae bacterium]|nr:TrkA family potassium uptake protein [Oscillospiraceae bacterium]
MKSFCIIGLGRFGQTLAKSLVRNGHEVVIVDEDEESINALADYVSDAVIGDPTNEAVLRQAGVADADCVVISISNNLNDCIITTLLLKDMGVKKVVVRANSDLEWRVLEKVGADMVVFPEKQMGEKLAYTLDKNNVMDHIQFSNEYSIVETSAPSQWIGKSMIELNIRRDYGVNVIAVSGEDGKMNISPDPKKPFSAGDTVTVIGENRNIDKLVKMK